MSPPPLQLPRRQLLLYALAGTAGAGLAGALGVGALSGSAPKVKGLIALSQREYLTISRLAEALFPEGGPFPAGARALDLGRLFDGYLATEPRWIAQDLKRALQLLEFGPLLFERRLVAFSSLPEAERLAHFERWGQSQSLLRRQVAVALRRFLALCFYDSEAAWAGIGYEGPVLR
jgi:hypothetical protein